MILQVISSLREQDVCFYESDLNFIFRYVSQILSAVATPALCPPQDQSKSINNNQSMSICMNQCRYMFIRISNFSVHISTQDKKYQYNASIS